MSPQSLPHPSDPDAPKYWRHETGGRLRIAVEAFLFERLMTVRDVALMRAYLRQWIDSPAWDMNPMHDPAPLAALRASAAKIQSVGDIRRWIKAALDQGIDPL